MKRIILDANICKEQSSLRCQNRHTILSIYGEIIIDTDIEMIKGRIRNAGVIYGFRVIRNEMRIDKSKIMAKRNSETKLDYSYARLAALEAKVK